MTRDQIIISPKSGPELSARQKLWLIVLVVLKRLRFLAILAAVGLFLCKWDAIKLHRDRWTHPRAAAVREVPRGQEFFCPMHPQVVRSTYEPNGDVPNCPICGMPLSLHAKGQKEELPPGVTGRVTLSPERVAMAGIKTVTIGYRPMSRQTKTVGYVTYDESRTSRVVSRVDGYVEKLYVDKTFSVVHKGDPLAEIYSPEFYSTAKELILARADGATSDLAETARQKLRLLGVSEEEIAAIAASREPPTRLVIRSPQEGYVVDKKIVVGASVEAKMTLFEVAGLSTVWVEAEVYETDLAFLSPGQKVEARVEAWPEKVFRGEVAMIYPQVEAATRTNRLRVRLDNPAGELRPGMFAEVTIENSPLLPGEGQGVRAFSLVNSSSGANIPSPQPSPILSQARGGRGGLLLAVPESAVIDTGAKKIVYIDRGEGEYEGVEVKLGPRADDFYPVLKGLSAGDRVAAAGSFLVDAETRLNPAAASTYFGASGGPQTAAAPAADNRLKPGLQTQPSEEELKNLDQLPEEDRRSAKAQGICPVTGNPLGAMGVPVKITLRGKTLFVCCQGCVGKAKRDPEGTLKKLERK